MRSQQPETELTAESLNQLSKEALVQIILAQQKIIEQLNAEIEGLRVSRALDSQTSSKPPSSDLLKKPEKAPSSEPDEGEPAAKRKPGGQPGHPGKTRQGFSRIDRLQILKPTQCNHCGQSEWGVVKTCWLSVETDTETRRYGDTGKTGTHRVAASPLSASVFINTNYF